MASRWIVTTISVRLVRKKVTETRVFVFLFPALMFGPSSAPLHYILTLRLCTLTSRGKVRVILSVFAP